MTQGHQTLMERMLDRLMGARGWLKGAALAEGLSSNRLAIEDALADLVTLQHADYQQAVGYRLRAEVLCRNALRALRAQGGHRQVHSQVFEQVCRVCVAERREDVGLVTYALEMPLPAAGPDYDARYRQQLNALIAFTSREKAHV